jgi:hypothetical protein
MSIVSLKEVKMIELTWADQMQNKYEAQGKAKWLLESLALRKIKVEQAQKDTTLACTDLAQLDAWLKKSLTAKTAAQVFGTPAKVKPTKKK